MWQEGQPEILKDAEFRAGAGSQGGQRALKQFMTLVLCTCENAPRTHLLRPLCVLDLPHFPQYQVILKEGRTFQTKGNL